MAAGETGPTIEISSSLATAPSIDLERSGSYQLPSCIVSDVCGERPVYVYRVNDCLHVTDRVDEVPALAFRQLDPTGLVTFLLTMNPNALISPFADLSVVPAGMALRLGDAQGLELFDPLRDHLAARIAEPYSGGPSWSLDRFVPRSKGCDVVMLSVGIDSVAVALACPDAQLVHIYRRGMEYERGFALQVARSTGRRLAVVDFEAISMDYLLQDLDLSPFGRTFNFGFYRYALERLELPAGATVASGELNMIDVGFANIGNRWQSLRRRFFLGGLQHRLWSSVAGHFGASVPDALVNSRSRKLATLSRSLRWGRTETSYAAGERMGGFPGLTSVARLLEPAQFHADLDAKLDGVLPGFSSLSPVDRLLLNYRWFLGTYPCRGLIEACDVIGAVGVMPMNGLASLEGYVDLYRADPRTTFGKRIMRQAIAEQFPDLHDVANTPKNFRFDAQQRRLSGAGPDLTLGSIDFGAGPSLPKSPLYDDEVRAWPYAPFASEVGHSTAVLSLLMKQATMSLGK